MGGAVFPPCSLAWGQTGRGNGCNGNLLQKDLRQHPEPPRTAVATALTPCCRPTPHQRLPHTQASLAQSLVGSLLPSPGSWCAQDFVRACQESLCSSKADSPGILSPFTWVVWWGLEPSEQWELLWYDCPPGCESPAWRPDSGAPGDSSGGLGPQAAPPRTAAAGAPVPAAGRCRRPSDTTAGLARLLWGHCSSPSVLVHARFCLCPPSISGGHEVWS